MLALVRVADEEKNLGEKNEEEEEEKEGYSRFVAGMLAASFCEYISWQNSGLYNP